MSKSIFTKMVSLMVVLCLVFGILNLSGCKKEETTENNSEIIQSEESSANGVETSSKNNIDYKKPTTSKGKTSSKPKSGTVSSGNATSKVTNTSKGSTTSKSSNPSSSSSKTQSAASQNSGTSQSFKDGTLKSFSFLVKDNPQLPFDVNCDIGSTSVTATLPAGTKINSLKPTYTYTGGNIGVSGSAVISGKTALDFSKNVTLTLGSEEKTVKISVMETGMPSISITVDQNADITSKTSYVGCRVVAAGGDYSKYPDYAFGNGKSIDVKGKIKGRGWTSWYYYPKKSYTLKLDKKQNLLGMSESKEWVLAANFADRSLIRNAVGMELAHNVGVEAVMDVRFVDLWVNGEYVGNYQLIEKIEIEKDRVNITEFDSTLAPDQIGYIVETNGHNKVEEFKNWTNGLDVDRPNTWSTLIDPITLDPISGDMFFNSKHYTSVFNINKPSDSKLMELSVLERNKYLNYIYDYVDNMEASIKTRDFTKASEYLDMNAMAKWYIVNELSMNTDSKLHASCYMYKDAGTKMKMGPLWDFDLGFGNGKYANENNSNKTYLDEATWFKDLLAMPQFKAEVKKVWNNCKDKVNKLPQFIDSTAKMTKEAWEENFYVWDVAQHAEHTYQKTTEHLYDHSEHIDYLKTFTQNRISYMNNKISNW